MDSTQFQDHYEVLGVPVDADALEVRRAFRQRVKQIHPDVSADKAGATEAFIRLKEAYNVLADPELRTSYDIARANHRALTREAAEARRRTAGGPSSRTYGPGSSRRPGEPYGAPGTPGAPNGRTGGRPNGGPSHAPGSDTWSTYHRNLTVPEMLQRAMREIAAGRSAYARRDLVEILAREPENPDALVLMGRLYQSEGKVQEWIRVLEDGLRKNPGHVALRLALNEARRAVAEQKIAQPTTDEDLESRRRAYLAGGIISAALAMGWGALAHGNEFLLRVLVPVPAPLITGSVLCAFITGWTMAASGFIADMDDELFFSDTYSRPTRRKYSRNDAPLGLAVPVFALIHYTLALSVMAVLMLTRGAISRSLFIVSGAAFVLALCAAMAQPQATGAIMFWCPGWLLSALFAGWLIGDVFR